MLLCCTTVWNIWGTVNCTSPEHVDEQADAGRDCRNRLVRPKFLGANADREILIFPVQLTTSRIGNLTWLIHTLAI